MRSFLAAVTPEPFEAVAAKVRRLAGETPVLIGGEGAGAKLATRLKRPPSSLMR